MAVRHTIHCTKYFGCWAILIVQNVRNDHLKREIRTVNESIGERGGNQRPKKKENTNYIFRTFFSYQSPYQYRFSTNGSRSL